MINYLTQRKFAPKAYKQMRNIEGFISKTTLKKDMIFKRSTTIDEIRGVFGDKVSDLIAKGDVGAIGAKGLNKRFSSMSFSKNSEFGESYSNDIEIIYFAPKGTQACYAKGFSEVQGAGLKWKGEMGTFDITDENEFILNRNYTMRISNFEKLDNKTTINIDILLRNER